VVLAANAVQTPRLLLLSQITDESGLVGRCLMTHATEFLLTAGVLPGAATTRSQGCTLAIQDFYDSAPLAITLEPRAIGSRAGWQRAAPKFADRFAENMVVLSMVEDLPRLDNRVTLSPAERDAHGLPIALCEHQSHPLDVAAARFAAERSDELLAEAGVVERFSVGVPRRRFHVFGTCRMGDDPARSVTDRDGRLHRMRNLYIADGSLFVTSAGVNPALTIQALAARVADAIAARFSHREL
jgi:paromamine 6'-oxidase/6'''-hydroxyneomycin C oxidase/2'-deamino-2'-hydroxyparomamine 6'-oxidase